MFIGHQGKSNKKCSKNYIKKVFSSSSSRIELEINNKLLIIAHIDPIKKLDNIHIKNQIFNI